MPGITTEHWTEQLFRRPGGLPKYLLKIGGGSPRAVTAPWADGVGGSMTTPLPCFTGYLPFHAAGLWP